MRMIQPSILYPNRVQSALTAHLENIASWIDRNHLKMNVSKPQLMTLQRKCTKPPADISVQLRGNDISSHDSIKYLWSNGGQRPQFEAARNRCPQKKILAAVATIRSWNSCSTNLSQSIERVQNYGMRVILNKPPRTPSALLRNWRTLHQRRHTALLCKCTDVV